MPKIRSQNTRSTPRLARAVLAAAATLACSASLLLPAVAHAEAPLADIATRFKVNDENPVASIPTQEQRNSDPMEFGAFLQDLIARAEGAFVAKDWARSVKYYEALARTVPEHGLPFSRLCSGYSELGKLDFAIANCEKAVRLDGARVLDHFRLVSLILQKKELKPADVAELDASLEQLRKHAAKLAQKADANSPAPAPAEIPSAALALPNLAGMTKEQIREDFEKRRDALARTASNKGSVTKTPAAKDLPLEIEVLACRVGVRLNDPKRLDDCTKSLQAKHAAPSLSVPFAWARALITKDSAAAAKLLEQAKALHFPPATMNVMLAEQEKTFAPSGALAFFKRWGLLGLLSIAVGLGAIAWLRRTPPAVTTRATPS